MKRAAPLLVTVGWWAAAHIPAAGAPLSSEKSVEIASRIAMFLEQEGAGSSALSLSVSVEGDVVLAQGYGESAPGKPATAETIYNIGSITKQFTAAGLLAEIERGAVIRRTGKPLTLDTEIKDIFPGVEHWSVDPEHPVTVRRLLNMNSNLPNFTRRPPPGTDPWGTIPAVELMEKLKPLAQSGWPDSFEYSNTTYFLLSEIMEGVEMPGDPVIANSRDIVRKLLLDAAGLSATGFASDKAAPPHDVAKPVFKRKPVFHMGDWLKGSGDMVSNALDIARWDAALMDGRIIKAESRAQMLADGARIGPTDWYGMGWFIAREPERDFYYHSGTVPGYTSFNAIVMPRKGPAWLSVTLLTNVENVGEIDQLARTIVDVVLFE